MKIFLFNVFTKTPPNAPGWTDQAKLWKKLGDEVGASSEFDPLTIKALYVSGIILAACKSINVLLHSTELISTTYFAAYAIFASIIDLLGRCVRGNDTYKDSTKDIKAGFQWLAEPNISLYARIPLNRQLVTTTTSWGATLHEYEINELVAMRHFVAHGQATSDNLPEFDYTILGHLPPLLARGIEEYLKALESSIEPCTYLAKACVEPYRNRPVFDVLWKFQVQSKIFPASVADTLRVFDWTYKPPRLR